MLILTLQEKGMLTILKKMGVKINFIIKKIIKES